MNNLIPQEKPNRALNLWSFLFPPIGVIAYFALRKSRRAKSAACYAFGSAVLSFLGYALLWWMNNSQPEPALLFYAMCCWISALSDGILIRLWRRKQ